jgi:hypothetical protein
MAHLVFKSQFNNSKMYILKNKVSEKTRSDLEIVLDLNCCNPLDVHSSVE